MEPVALVPRELLTIAQACARAGVSRRTIYNWIEEGRLECIRTAGGRIRIYGDTLFRAFGRRPESEPGSRT